jgi:ATP-binding cassette subfamily B protein
MKKTLSDFENIKILVKTIFSINKAYIPVFLLTEILKAMETVVNIYLPMFFISAIEKSWSKEKIIKLILGLILIKIFLKTLGNILQRRKSLQTDVLNTKFPQVLAEKTMRMPYQSLEESQVLDLKERALFPIVSYGALYNFIFDASSIVRGFFTILASFSIIFVFSKSLVLLSILISILTIIIDKNMKKKLQSFQQEMVPINRKYGYYLSLMQNPTYQKEIRLFDMKDILLKKANGYIGSVFDRMDHIYIDQANAFSVRVALQTIIRFITYSYVGMRAFSEKFGPKIGLGQFALLVSANENFINSFKDIFTSFFEIKIDMGHLRPFSEFMLLEEKDPDKGEIELEDFTSLSFDHVTFSYPHSDRKILDDISFTIKKGEKISIVGLNNAGKTTIIKLICRFFKPDKGRILLNGRDLEDYEKSSYYKKISAVFQDFSLFPFSIEDNIVANLPKDREKLKKVSKSLDMDDFIENLEKGYQTKLYKDINEGAVDLSGGQKQKIAIARALYRKGDLVILDEPTAALDPLAEAEIFENFHKLTQNKTAIFISHRMSSSRFCDKILLLQDGKIKAFDSHENLMKSNNLYKDLFESQAHHFNM